MTTPPLPPPFTPAPTEISHYWIQGPAQSGKTTRLMAQFRDWMAGAGASGQGPRLLVFAATGDNRIGLVNRLTEFTQGQMPIQSTTPLAFFESEVTLFWPLLIQKLKLKPRFPLRLRPETEQELATRLWQQALREGPLKQEGVSEWRLVRRTLDVYLLAASSGQPVTAVASLLQAGMAPALGTAELWQAMGDALVQWRHWCLERGLLTYGLLTELYGQSLLTDPLYQAQLLARFDGVLADDVDEYPAIAQSLFRLFFGTRVLLTYNPQGGVRLGFGADPQAMLPLAQDCHRETLPSPSHALAARYGAGVVQMVRDAGFGGGELLDLTGETSPFRYLGTLARSQLLRAVAEEIIAGVTSGQVKPQEIAVVGPGVDAIARYTLMQILANHNINLEPLTEQRPLHNAPMVRALLTLFAFVYPGLGRLISPDQVAEMLVILSLAPAPGAGQLQPSIDPVRAGLLADYCYVPDPETPQLMPIQAFPRWDRLGYEASAAYDRLLQWLDSQRLQQQQRLLPSPLALLDRAIQTFLWNGSALAYDQLAALRELLESAQHYWDVEARLSPETSSAPPPEAPPKKGAIERFITLLRSGTITANPYPAKPLESQSDSVVLATLFQYRINRPSHRWQFWLDAGSPLWLTSSGTSLFGASIFTQEALADLEIAKAQSSHRALEIAQERLENGLLDLLGHASDRIYICTSDLATNGQPQLGPLLALGQMTQVWGEANEISSSEIRPSEIS